MTTFAHDGTERRIVRPQDPAEQAECYSGKKKGHTVKNVLLVNALLTILFLSATGFAPKVLVFHNFECKTRFCTKSRRNPKLVNSLDNDTNIVTKHLA